MSEKIRLPPAVGVDTCFLTQSKGIAEVTLAVTELKTINEQYSLILWILRQYDITLPAETVNTVDKETDTYKQTVIRWFYSYSLT